MITGDTDVDALIDGRAARRFVLVPYNCAEMGRCSPGLRDDDEAIDRVRELCVSDEIYDQVGAELAWISKFDRDEED